MKFKQWLKKEDPIIFEIGSNDGTDTLGFFEEFENPTVHCFEPYPDIYNKFINRLADKLNKSLYAHNIAISDEDGYTDFIVANNTYSGSLKKPMEHIKVHPDVLFTKVIGVPTLTLDTYMYINEIKHCDLVYMDVQGAEDLVFNGGRKFFSNCVDYVYTEFSNIELYENAPGKEKICELLPDFKMVQVIREWYADGDMLLINKRLLTGA